jgi:spore coat polysaccharide biosynthesis protein SpsF (cytidylyltransferase family)
MSTAPRRVAIIQARMSSSRFPGKVLANLDGLPLIVFMAQRVQRSALLDHVVVATSTDTSDDILVRVLAEHGIPCQRGSLHDVLDRFHAAARACQADHVVRLTGDCPLMDADLIDRGLSELAKTDCDYVSNVLPPSYPDGLDVECFTMAALETAWRHATLPSDREHVTPFIRAGHEGLRARGWTGTADFSTLRWTVDHPDDLAHVASLLAIAQSQRLARQASAAVQPIDRFDLLRALETGLVAKAGDHLRNEGYQKSLAEDSVNTPQ